MDFYKTTKPATRWWWFAGELKKEDIAFQLDWLRDNGFGGVEIAWVYPLPDSKPAPEWLSSQWSQMVAFAKEYAKSIGLFCDFTFGSLWPFGGSAVDESIASRDFFGLSKQRLRKSWEGGEHYVLNHLSRAALEKYSSILGKAFEPVMKGQPRALFCDSWEVAPENLWSDGLDERFEKEFGYSLDSFKQDLSSNPDILYDYRKFISRVVNDEFYRPFTETAHRMNGFTRIQAHGSPTNLLDSYACADVPETESILFDPHFSQFAASSAALSGKSIVSCETFTCLYGWKTHPGPGQHQFEENDEDLRMLADALFANGVNMIFWHGFPYNPKDGKNSFYASVHVGWDGSLAQHFKPFNAYMEKVSKLMRQGQSYFDCACYLPMEDNWMKGEVPQELRRPSAQYHWELHYQRFPEEFNGFRPCWISGEFLGKASVENRELVVGNQRFQFLFVDVDYLDYESLLQIHRLATDGLQVVMRNEPEEPGFIHHQSYDRLLSELYRIPNVSQTLDAKPMIESFTILEFWVRKTGDGYIFFIAHPASVDISYPMDYNQSMKAGKTDVPVVIGIGGRRFEETLSFDGNRPLILNVSDRIERIGLENLEEGI
jgi:hypothetical protein